MSYGRYKGPYNEKNPIPDGEARISIYNYTPALALGLIGAILFGLAAIGHFYFWWIGGKKRVARDGRGRPTRWFEALWTLGCVMEVVGYGFRTYSHKNPFYVNAFIIQYFFIVVAPVFFAAAVYLALKYAINLNEENLRISPVKQTFVKVFITIDTLTTILQIVGAALIGVAESRRANQKASPITSDQANDILLAGLAAQNASFLVFLVILGVIIFRIRKAPEQHRTASIEKRHESDVSSPRAVEAGLAHNYGVATYTKTFLWVLVVSSLLIFARTLYRLAETAEGVWGNASSIEALFGVFEFAPVVVAAWLWIVRPLRREMVRMS
ncbi:hypothetical protein FFLO_04650 [Filobasidium floriforme]|uniref:Uncharacterized protein n=1 Tax=Filobasidium floriforme TaxID=5210 RepID=A0A8K0JNV0_9TREE|nr:hypothetical protein FFLO_04650 [Filobasidium floriforme]